MTRSAELAHAEAVAVLVARLETWGVVDPHRKAADYVTDLVRQGWRPRGPRNEAPSYPSDVTACGPTAVYLAAKAAALEALPLRAGDDG